MIFQFLTDISWVVNLRSPILTPIFEFFTWLGYRNFLFMFIPFTYWCFDRKIFGPLILIVFFSALINAWLKDFFQDSRPDPILNIDPWLENGTSFGFPSGHTQIAVVIWLYIAMNIKNIIVKIISIIFLFGVPLSRLYLGVHDVGDILGGIFVGGIILIASNIFLKKLKSENFKLSLISQLIILFIIFLLFYLSWPSGEGAVIVLSVGGLVIGYWLGTIIDKKCFSFSRVNNIFLHILSSVIALIGFIFLNEFIEIILEHTNLPILLETALSSFILGFYISFLAFYLLSKFKIQSIK